jgi:hypothetical protein
MPFRGLPALVRHTQRPDMSSYWLLFIADHENMDIPSVGVVECNGPEHNFVSVARFSMLGYIVNTT